MGVLFEESAINGMRMRNRMLRSATWEGMCAPDGRPTEKWINCYCDLAKGGIGLIVSGYRFVGLEGKGFPCKMGIHPDDFAADYENSTRAVHDAGGTIAVQLVHAGGQAADPGTRIARPLAAG